MKKYVSESREVYEDYNHGQFSKKLAEWAIGNMKVADNTTGKMKPLQSVPLSEVKEILKDNEIKIKDEYVYTAWYLYNMSLADYPKSLKTDEARANFVAETLCDPDGCAESVLECFTAKMCCANVPIFWENYL